MARAFLLGLADGLALIDREGTLPSSSHVSISSGYRSQGHASEFALVGEVGFGVDFAAKAFTSAVALTYARVIAVVPEADADRQAGLDMHLCTPQPRR